MQTLNIIKKYEKYSEYKDSGVEWLGKIPKEWKIYNLHHLFTKVKRLGFENEQLLSVYRDLGVIIKSSRDDNHNKASDDLSTYQLIEIGDLAINKMKAWQGSIAISDYRGIVSPAYFICKPSSNNNSRFLHYLLRSDIYIKQYERYSGGVRNDQWDLNYDKFRKLDIPIPHKEEQIKVAKYLDKKIITTDKIIEKKQKQIELLQEKRTAVINNSITKGLNGKAELIESGIDWIGTIPKGWVVEKLKNRTTFLNGYSFESDEYVDDGLPIIRISDVGQEVDFLQVKRVPYILRDKIKKFLVKRDDLLIALTGGTIGKTSIYDKDEEIYLNQRVGVIRPNKQLNLGFLKFQIASDIFKKNIELFCIGGAQPNIGKNEIGNIYFAFPSKVDQEKIVDYLDKKINDYDKAISYVEKSIELLQEFKSSLISNVVTGKIKI